MDNQKKFLNKMKEIYNNDDSMLDKLQTIDEATKIENFFEETNFDEITTQIGVPKDETATYILVRDLSEKN